MYPQFSSFFSLFFKVFYPQYLDGLARFFGKKYFLGKGGGSFWPVGRGGGGGGFLPADLADFTLVETNRV